MTDMVELLSEASLMLQKLGAGNSHDGCELLVEINEAVEQLTAFGVQRREDVARREEALAAIRKVADNLEAMGVDALTGTIPKLRDAAAVLALPHTGRPQEDWKMPLLEQARRVRNFSDPNDIFEAVPVSAFSGEQAAPAPQRAGAASPTVDETLDFITKAHFGQVDKIGEPYWKHPARVMARIPNATDHERLVALLHDILEDTNYTALDLLKMGYPFDVVWDVNTLTKPKNAVPYRHRISTIAALGSQAAIRVKIADLEDNLDPPRFSKLQEQDQHRLGEKYRGAIDVLRAALIADQQQPEAK